MLGSLSAWFRYVALLLLNRRYELLDQRAPAMLEILKLMRMGTNATRNINFNTENYLKEAFEAALER